MLRYCVLPPSWPRSRVLCASLNVSWETQWDLRSSSCLVGHGRETWVSAVCKSLLQNSVAFWEDAWGSMGVEHPCCPLNLCCPRPCPESEGIRGILISCQLWILTKGLRSLLCKKNLQCKKLFVFTQPWVPWRSHGHSWWGKPQSVVPCQPELQLLPTCYQVITKQLTLYSCSLVRYLL